MNISASHSKCWYNVYTAPNELAINFANPLNLAEQRVFKRLVTRP